MIACIFLCVCALRQAFSALLWTVRFYLPMLVPRMLRHLMLPDYFAYHFMNQRNTLTQLTVWNRVYSFISDIMDFLF